jgi:hypothetical protein
MPALTASVLIAGPQRAELEQSPDLSVRTNERHPLRVSRTATIGGMAMQFTRVVSPVEDMGIWNGSSDCFSFVISYESRSGPGFHGPPGYVASWRSLSQKAPAIPVGGSPFETLAEAEEACNAMLRYLTRNPDGE